MTLVRPMPAMLSVCRVREWPLAVLTGVVAFLVYWLTLLPDVGGPEDTPKFQYLGAVLGIAHQPGYPLHTMLSYVFSNVPVGTVAFRANLLSAACGAVAVALAFFLARATGSRRVAAWMAALTLAFGARFWRYSVLAEVYTLAAALLLGVALGLVRWRQTGQRRYLFAASACFGLSLGNQLSIAALVPAIVLLLLVTNAREVLRPRVFLPAAAIVASGFLQYLYVLVRTRQHVRYREAAAFTLGDLRSVIFASDYRDYVFPFTWPQFVHDRLPEFWELLRAELGLVGLALAALGVLVLLRRDWRVGAFLLLAFGSISVFIVNVFGDLPGFLVMPIGLLAPSVAAGADQVIGAAQRAPGRMAALTLSLVAVAYPLWPLRANLDANDWSARTADARFFRELFDRVPPDTTFITEDYVTDSMVDYFLAAERHDRGGASMHGRSDYASVSRVLEAGTPIVGFDATYGRLAPRGVVFEPIELGAEATRHAYWLRGVGTAQEFGDAKWHDVSAEATDGRIGFLLDNYRAFEARIVVYAWSDAPLRPQVMPVHRFGRGRPSIDVRRFDQHDQASAAALETTMAADDLGGTAALHGPRFVTRIEHRVNDQGDEAAWAVTLGAVPARVMARANADRPELHRAVATALPAWPGNRAPGGDRAHFGAGSDWEWLFGEGWHDAERDGEGEFRWSSAIDARLLLPLPREHPLVLKAIVQGRAGTTVGLLVDAAELGTCRLTGGWQVCEWRVPASANGRTTSEVVLRSSSVNRPVDESGGHDARPLGVALRRIDTGR